MKRWFWGLLVLAMLTGVLAGCGKKEQNVDATNQQETDFIPEATTAPVATATATGTITEESIANTLATEETAAAIKSTTVATKATAAATKATAAATKATAAATKATAAATKATAAATKVTAAVTKATAAVTKATAAATKATAAATEATAAATKVTTVATKATTAPTTATMPDPRGVLKSALQELRTAKSFTYTHDDQSNKKDGTMTYHTKYTIQYSEGANGAHTAVEECFWRNFMNPWESTSFEYTNGNIVYYMNESTSDATDYRKYVLDKPEEKAEMLMSVGLIDPANRPAVICDSMFGIAIQQNTLATTSEKNRVVYRTGKVDWEALLKALPDDLQYLSEDGTLRETQYSVEFMVDNAENLYRLTINHYNVPLNSEERGSNVITYTFAKFNENLNIQKPDWTKTVEENYRGDL